MRRNTLIDFIFKVAKSGDAFDRLEAKIAHLSLKQLKSSLLECGIMPEVFSHDSSEEKLWAKYSDILLSKCLLQLGIKAEVLRTRGDSADVFGKSASYSLVGDAKTFRLSRTAKNQKDFKIKSLDDWRRNDDFALLLGPLSQFPSNRSQIYAQAIDRNVTLISYVHMLFLLEHYNSGKKLNWLWNTGKRLKSNLAPNKHKISAEYWQEIDLSVCKIAQKTDGELSLFKKKEFKTRQLLGEEGIAYWEQKIRKYKSLSKKEAIRRLIKSDKIEAKIEQIRKAVNRGIVL